MEFWYSKVKGRKPGADESDVNNGEAIRIFYRKIDPTNFGIVMIQD